MSETTLIRDAVLNATVNANRKKSKPFIKLWKKKAVKGVNQDSRRETLKKIQEIEKKENGWIRQIYEANRGKIKRNK